MGRVLAGANAGDSPLLGPTLDQLDELAPLPEQITVHLDAGYDSLKTRDLLAERGLHGDITRKGEKAPVQATQRWHVERTNAWHNAFNRLQRCYERRKRVIDAFFDLADAVITVRSLIRKSWTTHIDMATTARHNSLPSWVRVCSRKATPCRASARSHIPRHRG